MKNLANSVVKEETVYIKEDIFANDYIETRYDGIGNSGIPTDYKDVKGDDNDTKSISVENIATFDIPDKSENSENHLHKCEECGVGFRWKNVLVRHVRSQHEGARYSCSNFDYQAATQWDLKRHNNSILEGIKYFCDKYEFQATYQNNIRTHKKSIHEGVKYLCDQCDYQATRRIHLKTRKQTKHEVITFSCDQCAYQATRQHNLKTHKHSMHEGIGYLCDQCEYQTGQIGHFKKHKLVKHSKLNPHAFIILLQSIFTILS